jgi:hypothetical protein
MATSASPTLFGGGPIIREGDSDCMDPAKCSALGDNLSNARFERIGSNRIGIEPQISRIARMRRMPAHENRGSAAGTR